jgi:APA family basic amino acid/polyamine antiporter
VVVGPAAPQVASEATPALTAPDAAIGWIALITGFQIVLGAYDGWQGPAFFAEEDKDPARNIPRAFFRSAVIILVVYLGINLCVFTVLNMESLRTSELPVALVIEALLGPVGRTVTGIAAAVMALFTLNAIIMTNPRILFGLARDGLFVKGVAKVNRGGTPWVALLISSAIAIPMILTGAYVFVFKIQVATGILAGVLYNASYFTLRAKRPDLPRPFRAIGHPVLPALILLITTALFFGVIIADPEAGLWTAGLIAICVPVGIHLGRQRRQATKA